MVYVHGGKVYTGHRPQGAEYNREPTRFSLDGGLDLTEKADLHLYICAACPWAHRTLIIRNLSPTLRKKVMVSVVSPFRDDAIGWEFLNKENQGKVQEFKALPVTKDASPLNAKTLLDVYLSVSPKYTGNITTPTLYDAKSNTIISNDSFGIMRNFVASVPSELLSLYPSSKARAIDEEGRSLDDNLAKRVYQCGLAKTQEAYESSLVQITKKLDQLELRLQKQAKKPYLVGSALSLADVQLIACLVRFDAVYFSLFKCYGRRIASYPALSSYTRSVAAEIGQDALCLDMPSIVHHYWSNFTSCNPNATVPLAYRGGTHFLDGGIDIYRESKEETAAQMAPKEGQQGDATNQDQTKRKAKGEFVRGLAAHRNWLGSTEFPLERGRYVLFAANNCPWCHRSLLARAIYPGVKDLVEKSILFYRRGGPGNRWRYLPAEESGALKPFELERPGLFKGLDKADPTGNGFVCAPEIYKAAVPGSTETSVPILFDRKTKRVVSNESADIVRMFAMASGSFDKAKQPEIDALNARIYQDINNGAYRAGFSSSQATHEEATQKYFRALDWLNNRLAGSKFLCTTNSPTEADLRLFPTVFRHDAVYYARMKLNIAMVRDYPNLNRWLRDMKEIPGVKEASRIDHCVAGYFGRTGNGIVPFVGLSHDGSNSY